jgi:hypothetical protein
MHWLAADEKWQLASSLLNPVPSQHQTDTQFRRQRLKVLVLEKNKYVGGMASTVEHLKGYKHDVAASVLFPLSDKVVEDLEQVLLQ